MTHKEDPALAISSKHPARPIEVKGIKGGRVISNIVNGVRSEELTYMLCLYNDYKKDQ
jgi:hypothetical protein